MASPCSEMHESVNSSHDNGNARVEEISEYGVEPLITIRAMTFCQQRVNSNGQNFENLLTDESQVQIEERTKNSNMEEQTSAPTSDESGFEESYQIGVDSTTIKFTCLLDDSVQLKPLWVLSLGTLDRFGNFLNNTKTLRTEEPDRQLRDWRGLQDQANLSLEQRERVKASKNKAGKVSFIYDVRV